MIHTKNYECKENESFKLIKKSKGDIKRSGKTCDLLKRKSMCVEEWCETFVEKLKTELFSVTFLNQEEEHLEIDNIRKSTDNEFVVDTRLKYFEESDKDEESEEDMEKTEGMSSEEMIESEK